MAATGGPGLIGGVLVGATTGKAIALVHGLAFLGINHLEGHALTARLTDGVAFPYLLLLVSGGHCQLLAVEGVGRYRRLGTTIDDAAGEAFDKTAKLLGLGYPGGPAVERAAAAGDPARFELPRPMLGRPGCDFSFSGLEDRGAPARRRARGRPRRPRPRRPRRRLPGRRRGLAGRPLRAAPSSAFEAAHGPGRAFVVAGGVAANRTLRAALSGLAERRGMRFVAPPLALCTDNAAMIAWAGQERLALGLVDGLDFRPRPRWPLDPDAARSIGAGAVKA